MIHFKKEERPVGIQIFGSDPKIMNKATKYIINNFKPDLIDINYGCPVPKVTKKGGGSAALKDLCLMDDITIAVVEAACNTPVTVKMRAGWDMNNIIINEAGPRLEQLGIKALTLHPRTTVQKYNGSANWDLIKNLKRIVSIPVIGNGDVKNIDDIKKMFEYTECDAVMIARAAQGNPWIFDKAKELFNKNHKSKKISLKNISSMCREHFRLLTNEKGNSTGMNLMRKHFSNYLKGFPKASIFRQKLVTAHSYENMMLGLNEFEKYANEES
jgi:tRNA-dihydrouridine synthase B